jgi:hypothetical protein
MKVSQITSTVKITFDYPYFAADGTEATDTVTVHAKRLPFRRIAELQTQLLEVGENAERLADIILPVIASWDLTDDDGKPWEISRESLLDLPADFVALAATEIVGKLVPGSQTQTLTVANSATI